MPISRRKDLDGIKVKMWFLIMYSKSYFLQEEFFVYLHSHATLTGIGSGEPCDAVRRSFVSLRDPLRGALDDPRRSASWW